MTLDEQIKTIETMVGELLSPETDLFLVSVRIKPTNNVRVYIDGDQGVGIGKLATINRSLYKKLEESGLFPAGDFSLEVSSPGVDEPLKLHRQYLKNRGRLAEVSLVDGQTVSGNMVEVSEDGIVLEEPVSKKPGAKKKEPKRYSILFSDIKTTKIQITF